MSLDLENKLKIFLASSPQKVHLIRTIVITHSALSKVWRLWREPYEGETSQGLMQPVNMQIKLAGQQANLDQQYTISIDTTDPENTFRNEINRIPLDTEEKIKIVFTEYLSDDLFNPQAQVALQVESVAWQIGSASITAITPRLNVLRTGELYAPRDVPMLRGFL